MPFKPLITFTIEINCSKNAIKCEISFFLTSMSSSWTKRAFDAFITLLYHSSIDSVKNQNLRFLLP